MMSGRQTLINVHLDAVGFIMLAMSNSTTEGLENHLTHCLRELKYENVVAMGHGETPLCIKEIKLCGGWDMIGFH